MYPRWYCECLADAAYRLTPFESNPGREPRPRLVQQMDKVLQHMASVTYSLDSRPLGCFWRALASFGLGASSSELGNNRHVQITPTESSNGQVLQSLAIWRREAR